MSVTISGPPSTLKLLFSFSKRLSNASKAKLPIAAAFHARHLGELNASKIVGTSSLLDRVLPGHAQIYSTSSGKPYVTNTLMDLLHQITVDVLGETLNWTKVVADMVSSLCCQEVTLTAVGPTNAASSICKALKEASIKVAESGQEKISLTAQPALGESGAIAVVGMSGRFPGSESLEDFWRDLEDGRDLVKHVIPNFLYETRCLLISLTSRFQRTDSM